MSGELMHCNCLPTGKRAAGGSPSSPLHPFQRWALFRSPPAACWLQCACSSTSADSLLTVKLLELLGIQVSAASPAEACCQLSDDMACSPTCA